MYAPPPSAYKLLESDPDSLNASFMAHTLEDAVCPKLKQQFSKYYMKQLQR